jgi:hypothetical protein
MTGTLIRKMGFMRNPASGSGFHREHSIERGMLLLCAFLFCRFWLIEVV